MNKVGILYHPMIEAASRKSKSLEKFLSGRGTVTWVDSAWEIEKARSHLKDTALLLSVGGDGTVLRAAQVVIPTPTPITGVNLGTLGFMTELAADEAEIELPNILGGKGWLDERAMLEVTAGDKVFHALNDVVVGRGAIPRLVHIEARIDGQLLTTYRADGVIVATATGSTGYSLAAGGPILPPQSQEKVLVPIVPHLSLGYPLVLAADAVIELRIKALHQPSMSIDGHINLSLANNDTVTVKLSSNIIRFLRIHPPESYYGSLEQKLKGKK
jgi:NAD+ kinase